MTDVGFVFLISVPISLKRISSILGLGAFYTPSTSLPPPSSTHLDQLSTLAPSCTISPKLERGTFICLYAGEYLTTEEARQRWNLQSISRFNSSISLMANAEASAKASPISDESDDNSHDDREGRSGRHHCLNATEDETDTEIKTETAIGTRTGNESHISHQYQAGQTNYILSLRLPSSTIHIDPRYKGNVGRFLNHSCDPNCVIQPVFWGPRGYPRAAIFVSDLLALLFSFVLLSGSGPLVPSRW